MTADLLAAVFEHGSAVDIAGSFVVLAAMAYLANDEGNVCCAADEVARAARVSVDTVRRAQAALALAGDVVQTKRGVGRKPSTWHVAQASSPGNVPTQALTMHVAHATSLGNVPTQASRTRARSSSLPKEPSVLPGVVPSSTRDTKQVKSPAVAKRQRARTMRPREAEARAVVERLWTLCGDGPKPTLNGSGSPFMAAVKIAEKELDAGNDAEHLADLMFAAHQEATITVAAINMQRTKQRRNGSQPQRDHVAEAEAWLKTRTPKEHG